MGNLHSVKKKLDDLKVESVITSDPAVIASAEKLILPGVGHFGKAMDNLKELGLIEVLNKAVLNDKKPILGICLGMQLMAKRSEEGNVDGFAWFDAQVVRFNVSDKLNYKVPHIGWNRIGIRKKSSLLKDIEDNSEFYFVHSYFMKLNNPADELTTTVYEEEFTSSIEKGNVYGVQFHPEKSHDVGKKMIENFVGI